MLNTHEYEREPFVWIDAEIRDFDHFLKAVHSWKIDFLQLDGGAFYSHLQQIILPEIQIGHTHFDCHIDQKGSSPENMWTFVIMGEDATMFNFNHQRTETTSTMVIYSPGYEINAVTYPGFHIYTLSVEQGYMKKIAASLGLNHIEEKLRQIDRVELTPEQAEALRSKLRSVLNHAALMDEKSYSEEEKSLLTWVLPVSFLKAIHLHAGCAPKRVFKSKHLLYMEARTYMHMHAHEDIFIDGIAKKFNLSKRTLQNYFQEELNISPKHYLITLRLNNIRKALMHSKGEKGAVERIARANGFQHMGQFSRSYKTLFGELPSQTLKR